MLKRKIDHFKIKSLSLRNHDKEKLKNLLANLKTEKDCRTLYYYLSKRME